MTDTGKAFNEWYDKNYNFGHTDPMQYRQQFWYAGVEYGRAKPVIQPMETAPKDGSNICLWRGTYVKIVRYIMESSQYIDLYDFNNQPVNIKTYDGWTPTPEMKNE